MKAKEAIDQLKPEAWAATTAAERLHLLEEVRVGRFAEKLGARGKASPKRLDRELEALERELGLH